MFKNCYEIKITATNCDNKESINIVRIYTKDSIKICGIQNTLNELLNQVRDNKQFQEFWTDGAEAKTTEEKEK